MTKLVIGKTVKIPCMRPGPCRYSDEMVYLSSEALARMAESAHGIPVVVEHVIVNTDNVEHVVVGRVADMHPIEDGAWEAHFVVDDPSAIEKLKNGWGVSTAYRISESGPGGTFNAIPYDREVMNAKYEHLAIVSNPRYEFAVGPTFYNSADPLQSEGGDNTIEKAISIGGRMFSKLFKRTREEVKVNDVEDLILEKDGKDISVADVLKENEDGEKKYNELLSRYNELEEKFNGFMKKKNEEDEEKKKKEEDEEKKKNEEDEEKEKKEEDEAKENELRMNSLRDAKAKGEGNLPPAQHMTLAQKVAAGRAAYGSGK